MNRFSQLLSPGNNGTSTNHHSKLGRILFSAKTLIAFSFILTSLSGQAKNSIETEVVTAPGAAYSTSLSGPIAHHKLGGGGSAGLITVDIPVSASSVQLERLFPQSVIAETLDTDQQSASHQVLVILKDKLGNDFCGWIQVTESAEGLLFGSTKGTDLRAGTYRITGASNNALRNRVITMH